MTRRDQQTGDPADGQVSLVIHDAGKCGFDSLRSCAGRHWGERFRIGPNQVPGAVALGSCEPRGMGLSAGKLAQSGTNHLDRPPGAAESDAS